MRTPIGDEAARLIDGYALSQQRRRLTERTIYQRSTNLRTFARAVEPVDMLEVDTEGIQAFLDTRRAKTAGANGQRPPCSAKTRYGWITTLSGFYKWAIKENLIFTDPTAPIDRPILRQGLPRPISERDLAVALAYADPMMKAWLMLMAFSSARCCEIARLERDDVLDSEGKVRLLGKGEKWRLLPLHPLAFDAMRKLGMPTRGPVFRRANGTPFPPARVSRITSVYLHDLGIDATAHQLRHRFATRFHEINSDMALLAELMGHANMNTTRVYTRLNPAGAREAIEALPVPHLAD